MKGQSKQAKIIIDCHSQVIRTSLESLEWWMVGEKDVVSTERTWEVHKMKHGWGWLGEGLVISQHEPLLQWRIQLASQGKASEANWWCVSNARFNNLASYCHLQISSSL